MQRNNFGGVLRGVCTGLQSCKCIFVIQDRRSDHRHVAIDQNVVSHQKNNLLLIERTQRQAVIAKDPAIPLPLGPAKILEFIKEWMHDLSKPLYELEILHMIKFIYC